MIISHKGTMTTNPESAFFFQLMARKDGKEMHMGTLWQVWKMLDHFIVSCFMFFMADFMSDKSD